MAGTVTLSLTQQFDNVTQELLIGGRLYSYAPGTTTPQNAYTSAALSTPYANPLTLESDGRIPLLWFADGSIRIRLTNEAGVVQFDYDNLEVIGASGGGGGGVDTTDPNSIASTGDMKWRPSTATLAGWVRAGGRTIGSSTSGASERSNADCEALFLHLWGAFSDTICPVVAGRGASAAADWSANKQITLIDMRGRGAFGVDDMGNTAAGRITSASITGPTTGGSSGGTETHTLTEAQLPSHTHTGTTSSATPTITSRTRDNLSGSAGSNEMALEGASETGTSTTLVTQAAHDHTITTAATGSGTAHNNMPPTVLGCWFMRL